MFLNNSFLGVSYLEKLNQLPIASPYSGITFYGSNIIDEVCVKDKIYSDDEIAKMKITDYSEWDGNTLLLSRFDQQDLQAGNVLNLELPITKWLIYRKDVDGVISKKLIELDVSETEYIDYTVQGNKKYVYDIFPMTANEIGEPLETTQTLTDFWGWFLVDKDTETVYKFDSNLESGELTNDTDITTYKTFNKYNSYSFGEKDIIKGNIVSLVGNYDECGDFIPYSVDQINDLHAFINNGKDKLFKSPHGDIWKVITSGFKCKYLDETTEQAQKITFDFEESGNIE